MVVVDNTVFDVSWYWLIPKTVTGIHTDVLDRPELKVIIIHTLVLRRIS